MIKISDYIDEIPDPRANQGKKHPLPTIIILALYAIIIGAKSWIEIQFICNYKINELEKFTDLQNGVPSHDTFQRVFAKLDSNILNNILTLWVENLLESLANKHLAIDGKVLRKSIDTANEKSAIHTLNAFVVDTLTVIRQEVGDKKDSEITLIPILLDALNIKGAIITIDAIGCQTEITKCIREKNANYVIGLKANQPNLHQEAIEYFDFATNNTIESNSYSVFQTLDKNHGRIENRSYFCLDTKYFPLEYGKRFTDIKTLVQVTRTREIKGVQSVEKSYYISSLECNAKEPAKVIRGHWAIENSLHYVLDVIFDEDKNRTRKKHAPANFSLLKKIALNLINRHKAKETKVSHARLRAMMDTNYAELLFFGKESI